jgi:hypothetical protein
MMPSGLQLQGRILVWTWVMGGPVVGSSWGLAEFSPVIALGWLGLLLISAHPLQPGMSTGCVTLVGFSLWYFAGFWTIMMAAWGA